MNCYTHDTGQVHGTNPAKFLPFVWWLCFVRHTNIEPLWSRGLLVQARPATTEGVGPQTCTALDLLVPLATLHVRFDGVFLEAAMVRIAGSAFEALRPHSGFSDEQTSVGCLKTFLEAIEFG